MHNPEHEKIGKAGHQLHTCDMIYCEIEQCHQLEKYTEWTRLVQGRNLVGLSKEDHTKMMIWCLQLQLDDDTITMIQTTVHSIFPLMPNLLANVYNRMVNWLPILFLLILLLKEGKKDRASMLLYEHLPTFAVSTSKLLSGMQFLLLPCKSSIPPWVLCVNQWNCFLGTLSTALNLWISIKT